MWTNQIEVLDVKSDDGEDVTNSLYKYSLVIFNLLVAYLCHRSANIFILNTNI
jgi:hypothetical protein